MQQLHQAQSVMRPTIANDEGQNSTSVPALKDLSQTNDPHSGIESGFCKAFATLQAQFALLGLTLEVNHHGDDMEPTFWVGAGTQAHPFKSLSDIRKHLVQIGGAQ